MRTCNINKKRKGYGITAAEKRNRRRSKIQDDSKKPISISTIAIPAANADSSSFDKDDVEFDFEFKTQADEPSPPRKSGPRPAPKQQQQRRRKQIVIDSEESSDNDDDDDTDDVSAPQNHSRNSALSKPFKCENAGPGGDRITNLLRGGPSRSRRLPPTMTQNSHVSGDSHEESRFDEEMNPIASSSNDIVEPPSHSLSHKPKSQPQLQSFTYTQRETQNDKELNANMTSSETSKESDYESIELLGRNHHSRRTIPSCSSKMDLVADNDSSNCGEEHEFEPDNESSSSSQEEDGGDPSSEEFLPTQEVKRNRASIDEAKGLPSPKKTCHSRPRRICATRSTNSQETNDAKPAKTAAITVAKPVKTADVTVVKSAKTAAITVAKDSSIKGSKCQELLDTIPKVSSSTSARTTKKSASKSIQDRNSMEQCAPKQAPAAPQHVATRFKALTKLTHKLCALKASSSKSSVEATVKNIVSAMDDLHSMEFRERAIDIDIAKMTAHIMKGAFGKLREKHTEEAIVLVNFCIHCNLESKVSKAMVSNLLCKTVVKSAEILIKDADIFQGVLSLLAIVSSGSNMTKEQFVMPLLNFLHCIPGDLLVEHASSLDSKDIGKYLFMIVTSLPKLHSYWWIEFTLAFIYKLRYHLLSSIDQLSNRERAARIQLALVLFDSIPSNCLEGIAALDPPLSNTTLKRLYKDGASICQEQSFLEWSREVIRDLGCKHISCYTCNGIYAPLNPQDYGLKIANIPWIDINQGGISFYANSEEISCGNTMTLQDVIASRHLVIISFDYLESNSIVLSDRKRTLTIPISTEQMETSGLGILLSKQSNRPDLSDGSKQSSNECDLEMPPSTIEIFLKKTDYEDFKEKIQKELNLSTESMLDESSASTMASLKSKMSHRRSSAVHKEVELSTKFGREHPRRLLDAEAHIMKELAKRVGSSPFSPVLDSDNGEDPYDENASNDSKWVTTPVPKPYSPFQSAEATEKPLQSQQGMSVTAAEITPLQPSNAHSRGSKLNFSQGGALEVLGAAWGVAEADLLRTCDKGFNPVVRRVAEAVNLYHDALEKAIQTINALDAAQKELSCLPIEQEIFTTIAAGSSIPQTLISIKSEWDRQRESHERDLVLRLCHK